MTSARQQAASASQAMPPQPPPVQVKPLDALSGLAGHGQYAQALTLLRTCEGLRAVLMPEESIAIEALLTVCECCDAEARNHHAALARAVEREHTLGQQLQALTARLLDTGAADSSATDGRPLSGDVSSGD